MPGRTTTAWGLFAGLLFSSPVLAQGLPGGPVIPSEGNRAAKKPEDFQGRPKKDIRGALGVVGLGPGVPIQSGAPREDMTGSLGVVGLGPGMTPDQLQEYRRTGRLPRRSGGKGKFIGLSGIVADPNAERGDSAQVAGTPSATGSKVGTWDGVLKDSDLTVGDRLGTYKTRDEAIAAGQKHRGPAVVLKNPNGTFDAYGLDSERKRPLTLDNVEQTDGHSVTNLTLRGSEVDDRFSGLVTEDGNVLQRPGRFSRNHLRTDPAASERVWTPERAADQAFAAMDGWGTDPDALFEALAQIPGDQRKNFGEVFQDRHDVDLDEMLDGDLSSHTGARQLADHMLKATDAIYTEGELRRDFQAALDRYRRSGGKLSDSSTITNVSPLTVHLANFADTNTDAEVEPFITGKEYALKQAIQQESERLGRPLSPGEVYGQALQLSGGDTYQAVLNSHNTLRTLARGLDHRLNAQVPAPAQGAKDTFGFRADPDFMNRHLQPIRGGGDEHGAWYHMFGVATMTMTAGKTSGTAMSYVEEHLISGDAKTDPLELYADLLGVEMGGQLSR